MVVFYAYSPLLLLFWMAVVPFLTGTALSRYLPEKSRRIGNLWLLGLLSFFVIFEIIAVFCMLCSAYILFSSCILVCAVIMLALSAAGVFRIVRILGKNKEGSLAERLLCVYTGHRVYGGADLFYPRRDPARIRRSFTKSELLYTIVFLILFAVQMIMAVVYAPFDGDDAYYVVLSLQAQQTDTINTINPYLGYSTVLDYRHALAGYVLWIAFIARVARIHATILSHTILPLFWIPMTYYVYARIGKILFKDKQELVPLFLSFLSVFAIFGNVSIYTPETFFLMRTWQGKSMIGNFLVPLLMYILLLLARREIHETKRPSDRAERMEPWLFLFLANAVAGFFSTSGIMVIFLLTAAGMCLIALLAKKRTIRQRLTFVLLGALSCVPGVILVGMAVTLK